MTEEAKQDAPNREFAVQRIYTKDISFETPNSPAVFQQEWKPETGVNLNTEVNKLNDDVFEVTLTVTVTTKLGEQTAYLAEVKQAGIFTAKGFPEQEMGPLLGAFCPNQLFPYVREVVSDLITKGSFPQMVLQPVNFDMIYAQHQQERAKRAETEAEGQSQH
ncbi:MAG: protein-export chaperone SecB [Candidatus Thiodiazotropha lotti]|uniref:Protein-export protein SecB n=1 Tax=Candidatus Thiodiazotropha endoloripes TaxID=1818881 RepID=A0A1E2UND8_9GAMM|nr:protein-export chaperone SecB [Candidatus Thiodiazotropha endoloripes]MCG7900659.1 protein-export chaperone SecB [Candidatus Thiodiazotropha weberae]MCG7991437.1 protein-export chaperone SecB [Candidatus Thiodiazotropha lotti]MCG7902320.1 protein-export chaperone SecB [Candidatus Thiodiazotropha weberae]MCG7912626.1 protein-export chaperone SecB [Candidatus Thiodiazotropha weberae]MCG8000918.1 protein-export chaperone SecB [Candidatus Thiodiazotropha lotti]